MKFVIFGDKRFITIVAFPCYNISISPLGILSRIEIKLVTCEIYHNGDRMKLTMRIRACSFSANEIPMRNTTPHRKGENYAQCGSCGIVCEIFHKCELPPIVKFFSNTARIRLCEIIPIVYYRGDCEIFHIRELVAANSNLKEKGEIIPFILIVIFF